MTIRFLQSAASFTALALLTLTSAAEAQTSYVDMFRSNSYTQTGNGNSLSLKGYFFSVDLNSVNPGDFATGTVTGPGPQTPVALILNPGNPTDLRYQTGFFPDQAAMDTAFPTGTYVFHGLGGTQGPLDATLHYTGNVYPASQPFLTGFDFMNLQGVNASNPISLHFSSYSFQSAASVQLQFLTIYDNTLSAFVYNAGFLPQTATGITISANTLASGHSFTYELIDSNRVIDTAGIGANFAPQLGFDYRTTGSFSTSKSVVPEPGVLQFGAIAAMFGVGMGLYSRRKKTILS